MEHEFDFSGYATRNDLLCGDGRIIRKNAFINDDGQTVPMIWNHDHTKPDSVLGHALLENREDGVYAYCKFNDTPAGQQAKELVKHGDVRSLSIFANKLKQRGNEVIHGIIRELSLVLAGANPGAFVDFVMAHGDDDNGDGVYANYDENALVLYHADNSDEKGDTKVAEETKKPETEKSSEKTIKELFDEFTPEQKEVVYALIGYAVEDATKGKKEDEVKHSDDASDSEKTVKEVFEGFTPDQKTVVYAIIGEVLANKEKSNEDEDIEGGNTDMKHNAFENDQNKMEDVLTHSDIQAIVSDAKNRGSLREAVLAHGIEDLDIMFPDHQALNNEPEFIKRDDDWVAKVLGGVHHTPFSRVKTVFADVTAAEARAKGYHKGNLKIEEVFKLLKRVTGPTTVYKKQKLDRDDMLDLDKSFNLLPFLKKEIRMMLNEEMARAFLVGDGRDPVEEANDKINEECIRPIWKMEELFTVKVPVAVSAAASDEDRAKAFIKACKKSRKQYKGSGNPSMFMSEDMLTDCLLIEDGIGHPLYATIENLKAALRVSEIIPVPVMEGLTRTDDDGKTFELAAIYVNLKDYNVGTDKGGEIGFFEDFDIDYNQHKYLMETRCSGTLVKPYSAVALEFVQAE